jgi:hypothetical protein
MYNKDRCHVPWWLQSAGQANWSHASPKKGASQWHVGAVAGTVVLLTLALPAGVEAGWGDPVRSGPLGSRWLWVELYMFGEQK